MSEELSLPLSELGEKFSTLRLGHPNLEERLTELLKLYGQTSPIAVWKSPDGTYEVVDGFKRLRAARALGWESLQARVLEVTSRAAMAAMMALNQSSRGLSDLEEGWVIRVLVREEGLKQQEVARLLKRDKSWVCRRLSLVERLSDELQEQLKLGLVTATMARELARLPRGNQEEVLAAVRKADLGTRDTARLVDQFNRADRKSQLWMLKHPDKALVERARPQPKKRKDERLSEAGEQLAALLGRTRSVCDALLVQVARLPVPAMTPTERPVLLERITLIQITVSQLWRELTMIVTHHKEEPCENSDDRGGTPPRDCASQTGRMVQSETGPDLPGQPQHGAQAPQTLALPAGGGA